MNFSKYLIVSLLAVILFFSTLSFNPYFFEKSDTSNNESGIDHVLLQNSYAIEKDDEKNEDNDYKKDEDDDSNKKKNKSIFNIVAVGDFDCNGEAEDTVDNIVDQDPELVLALGDFSYNGDADCWFEL